jgi:hypothetical protein
MKAITKLNKEVTQEILNIIKRKKGGKRNKPAARRTGKLRQTKALLTFDGENVEFDLDAIEYYQYLDQGTRRIKKPWFYTDEIVNSPKIQELVGEFLVDHFKEEIEKIWQ